MSSTRRPLLVRALAAEVIAMVSSAAVAVGAPGTPTSGPAGVRGLASPAGVM